MVSSQERWCGGVLGFLSLFCFVFKYFLHVAENANFHRWIEFKIVLSAASPCFRRWNKYLSISSHIAYLYLAIEKK